MNNKTILMLCTSSQNVITFRLPLIKHLEKLGHNVVTAAFDDEYKEEIKKNNINFFCLEDNNRSVNPLKILTLKTRYVQLIKEVNPDIVFTFMLKPNTFGVFAAKKCGVSSIYSMVEGAGDAFINNSIKWKVIKFVECFLYKRSFKHSKKVFFLNSDDVNEFLNLNLVKEEKIKIVNGIGVDLDKFSCIPFENDSTSFVMIARMLKTKGVFDYCKCAEIVKKDFPQTTFKYVGSEGTVKVEDIKEYIEKGIIEYVGPVKDTRPYMKEALAILLPSSREGMPMVIMEAEACGRPVVVYDAIGCRDAVINDYNGFIIENGNVTALAKACIELLQNKEKACQYGNNSRKLAEDRFDQIKINNYIVSEIIS